MQAEARIVILVCMCAFCFSSQLAVAERGGARAETRRRRGLTEHRRYTGDEETLRMSESASLWSRPVYRVV